MTSQTSPSVYTAHDTADLFNALPTTFGFMPSESICAIATHGPRHRFAFSIRVDLPETDDHVQQAADLVSGHLRRHGADGAIVLVLSERVATAERAAWAVENGLGPVLPVVSAWTDGTRCWTTYDDADPAGEPVSLDPHHPAVVSAVLAGQEILPDRAALEDRWRPLGGPRRTWLERIAPEVEIDVVRTVLGLGSADFTATGTVAVRALLESARSSSLDDGDLLRLCVWLTYAGVRTEVWHEIASIPVADPDAASACLALWRDVARRAPGRYAAVPYTVAACRSYLSGAGAEANIALDHALAADPGYEMARSLRGLIDHGFHPRDVREALRAGDGAITDLAPGPSRP